MNSRLPTCFTLAATMLVATTASADKLPDPPSASIISPADGAMFEGAPALVDVECEVLTGTGLDNIDLFVDDASVGQLTAAPWTFSDVSLEEGMHSLYVVANGSDGVGYPSATIMVAVVAGGETGGEGTGEGGGSGDEGDVGGTTTDDGGETGTSSGNCSTTERNGGAGLLGLGLLGLAILGLGRRRD
jgi:MYXO-CTERM domain-containing protein